jgi:hypothetical protein
VPYSQASPTEVRCYKKAQQRSDGRASPERADVFTTLSGCFLSAEGTVHFYSCLRDIFLHTGRQCSY